ncbi:MAG: hypothetical protein DWQ10_04165 [Calditrichaeota bacterium]|nr:MAG: hypothetical protein DWQ10_04165 [Calditrichota bacterium]
MKLPNLRFLLIILTGLSPLLISFWVFMQDTDKGEPPGSEAILGTLYEPDSFYWSRPQNSKFYNFRSDNLFPEQLVEQKNQSGNIHVNEHNFSQQELLVQQLRREAIAHNVLGLLSISTQAQQGDSLLASMNIHIPTYGSELPVLSEKYQQRGVSHSTTLHLDWQFLSYRNTVQKTKMDEILQLYREDILALIVQKLNVERVKNTGFTLMIVQKLPGNAINVSVKDSSIINISVLNAVCDEIKRWVLLEQISGNDQGLNFEIHFWISNK